MRPSLPRPSARYLVVAACSSLALVLVACGSGGGSPTEASAPTATVVASQAPSAASTASAGGSAPACDLLSDADIAEITGYAVESKADASAQVAYENACLWTLKDVAWEIVLGAVTPAGRAAYDRLAPYMAGTAISGLGDMALETEIADSILAVSGETFVDLQYVAVGEADDVERKLVERIFTNLAR